MQRKLWIDTRGEPVITTAPNGERNARRWGWVEAEAIPKVMLTQPSAVTSDEKKETNCYGTGLTR